MSHRPFLSALCTVSLAALAMGQSQNEEQDFNQRQAKALSDFADKAKKKGFPRIAKLVWMQAIKLYDPDYADAWKGLQYVKIGSSWNPDPKNPYPTQDAGSGADGQSLKGAYESLKRELANAHRAQAQKWAKTDRADRAHHHWSMVLRWVDDDKEAQKALEHHDVGGVTGTALEQTLFDRSKAIEKIVAEEAKKDYEVKKVDGVECAPLDRAQVKYITVQSEHFTLHGDAEEEANLMEALRWAERTINICKVAFPWQVADEAWKQTPWACFVAKETYQQVLRANNVPDLEWKLENTSTSGVGNTLLAATRGKQVLFDACVRNVARGWASFGSAGFNEGIGHTFVGMIFNNNRLFAVDLKKQEGTAASEEDREYQSPDFDVWKNLNLELAWKATGGVAARDLAFCDAAEFSNEQRIKAWSFCDYMMRRDPAMLRDLDQIAQELKKERIKNPAEFEARFQKGHDVTIAQLDKEWEDFWTGASPVMKAIQNNTPPLAAISKGVDKWLEAYNAARKENNATPALWSANLSTRCKEHAEYLKKNKDQRGPAAEHTENVDLGGSYVGSIFAEMAVIETKANLSTAKKTFERWLKLPGYRDALLNNSILTVGMYVDGDVLVINAVSGLGVPKASEQGFTYYPRQPGALLEGDVDVADLGPDVEALLEKHGKSGRKKVGLPISLHFGGLGGTPGNRLSFACNVVGAKGEHIEGALLFDDGRCRTSCAPGMVTFIPFEPLKGPIAFAWSWEVDGKQITAKSNFTAK